MSLVSSSPDNAPSDSDLNESNLNGLKVSLPLYLFVIICQTHLFCQIAPWICFSKSKITGKAVNVPT